MPNALRRYKTKRSRIATRVTKFMPKPINVKDLIKKAKLVRSDAAQFSDAERDWREFIATRLDPELLGRISAIAAQPPRLTIYAESSVWSARLRYVLAELEPLIRARDPSIASVVVRVRPTGGTERAGRSARRG
jgi:hypothetical protein